MSEVFGLWGAQLLCLDKRKASVVFAHEGGPAPPQAPLDYVREYHEINPRIAPSLRLGVNEWMHDHEYFDDDFVERDPFYRDFLIPMGGRYLSGTKLAEDDRHLLVFGAMRGIDARPLGTEEIRVLDRLKHHMLEALRLQDHLRRSIPAIGVAGPILEKLELPVMLIDEERCIVHRNGAASAFLAADDRLSDWGGTLTTDDAADNLALTLKVRSLELSAPETQTRPVRAIVRIRGRAERPILLFMHAIRPARVMQAFGHRPLILTFVYDPGATRDFDPLIVREAFGLTPAEARVAVGIAQGSSADELATSHRVSLHTLRAQIQAVLRKMGADRQADIVRVLAGLPAHGAMIDSTPGSSRQRRDPS